MRISHLSRWVVLLALGVGAVAGGRSLTAEEELEAGRYTTNPVATEVNGAWTATVERVVDRWTRAMRVWYRVQRTGPGAKPLQDGLLPTGGIPGRIRSPAEAAMRLNEQGWLIVGGEGRVNVFAPDAVTGVERRDLDVSCLSRFLPTGFLSVGMAREKPEAPALRIAWAPLTATGLGPAVEVARIVRAAPPLVLCEASVRAVETPEGVEIEWLVPGENSPHAGGARVEKATGKIVRLPPRPPATVRVAAAQCPSGLGEVAQNLERITRLVETAARGGAKFVVLPETAITGYLSQDLQTTWHVPGHPKDAAFPHGRDPLEAAEKVPGSSTEQMGALAARWGLYLTAPVLEVVETLATGAAPATRAYFNTVVLLGPDGTLRAHYRKLSPWPHPEQSWATPGDRGLAHAETPYGRVGLAICFDVHTVFERYARHEGGLWTLLYPIAWVSNGDDADWFGRALPERIKAAGFHVVGANWSVEAPQPWHGYGFSTIVARDGRVLAQAKTKVGSEVVYADLPLGR